MVELDPVCFVKTVKSVPHILRSWGCGRSDIKVWVIDRVYTYSIWLKGFHGSSLMLSLYYVQDKSDKIVYSAMSYK